MRSPEPPGGRLRPVLPFGGPLEPVHRVLQQKLATDWKQTVRPDADGAEGGGHPPRPDRAHAPPARTAGPGMATAELLMLDWVDGLRHEPWRLTCGYPP